MKLTNRHNLPEAFTTLVQSLIYDPRDRDPKRVAVTTLIAPPIQKLLSVRHWDEVEADVADYIWLILGIAGHKVMEGLGKDDDNSKFVSEEKLIVNINGIDLVGKYDLYNTEKKAISDWKFTSVFAVKDEAKIEWEQQLNTYAYIFHLKGLAVKELKIHAILKDWRKVESKRYSDYPPVAFKEISIPLWSLEKQKAYVEERIENYKKQLDLADKDLVICSEKERWHKPGQVAVYKGKNKKADRLLDTMEEASEYVKKNYTSDDNTRIEQRPGNDLKCTEYCPVKKFCHYYKQTYGVNK